MILLYLMIVSQHLYCPFLQASPLIFDNKATINWFWVPLLELIRTLSIRDCCDLIVLLMQKTVKLKVDLNFTPQHKNSSILQKFLDSIVHSYMMS
jgi:hypothetical protein